MTETNTIDVVDEKPSVKALNERLGITSKESLFDSRELKSVTEMLENSKKEFEEFKNSVSSEKNRVEDAEAAAANAVSEIAKIDNGENDGKVILSGAEYAVNTFKDAIDSMNSLIATGQCIISKLYDAIASTDLVDPDIIESTAKIIESVHVNLTDMINFNTQKMVLEHNYRKDIEMENMKHQHSLEKEYFKYKLREMEKEADNRRKIELEKAKAVDVPSANISTDENKVAWSQMSVMDIIRQKEKPVEVVDVEIVQTAKHPK